MNVPNADEQQALMEKAQQARSDAQLLLENNRTEAAINRIYYAAFDAARAALLMYDEAPSSHAGVKTRFAYHFVRTGRVSRKHARTLSEAEAMRNRADYDAFSVFEAAPTLDLLEDVESFVERVRDLL